jgi:hypothetical protein
MNARIQEGLRRLFQGWNNCSRMSIRFFFGLANHIEEPRSRSTCLQITLLLLLRIRLGLWLWLGLRLWLRFWLGLRLWLGLGLWLWLGLGLRFRLYCSSFINCFGVILSLS